MYKNNSTSRGGRKPIVAGSIVAGSVVALLLCGVITSVAYVRAQGTVDPAEPLALLEKHLRSDKQIRKIGNDNVKKNAKALRDVADTLHAINDSFSDTLEAINDSLLSMEGRLAAIEGTLGTLGQEVTTLGQEVTSNGDSLAGLDSRNLIRLEIILLRFVAEVDCVESSAFFYHRCKICSIFS